MMMIMWHDGVVMKTAFASFFYITSNNRSWTGQHYRLHVHRASYRSPARPPITSVRPVSRICHKRLALGGKRLGQNH
jgi:hypothetical protein